MMRRARRFFLGPACAAGVLLPLLAATPAAAQNEAAVHEAGRPASGLIVRLKQKEAPAQREASGDNERWQRVLSESGLSGSSGRREPRLRPVGRDQQLVEFERTLSRGEAETIRQKLLQRGDVEWAEPNTRERRLQVPPSSPPSDPYFTQQWWLQPASGSNANAIEARRRGVAGFQTAWLRAGASPAVVAVLDTGITAHEDMGTVLPGYDFVSDVAFANDSDGWDADPSDPGDWVGPADLAKPAFEGCTAENSSWHGTLIAGLLAAKTSNGLGGAGMLWGTAVLPVRVAGKCGAEVADIIDGMRWAAGLSVAGAPPNPNPARVINISFGGDAACGQAYQSAVDELKAKGVVVVAAAGNEWSAPTRPASCRDVVGVVGLNRDGFKSNYSNFGPQLSASGIATVSGDDADGAWGPVLADSGLRTLSNDGLTTPGAGTYTRLYGTSFAAPQVAGVIAQMLSLNPDLSHAQIVQGLRQSARPHVSSPKIAECADTNPGRCICTTATCGAGILDAERALMYASGLVLPPLQAAVIDNADVTAALARAPQDRPSNVVVVADGGGGSGGGAMGGFWLLALAAAALTLPAARSEPRR